MQSNLKLSAKQRFVALNIGVVADAMRRRVEKKENRRVYFDGKNETQFVALLNEELRKRFERGSLVTVDPQSGETFGFVRNLIGEAPFCFVGRDVSNGRNVDMREVVRYLSVSAPQILTLCGIASSDDVNERNASEIRSILGKCGIDAEFEIYYALSAPNPVFRAAYRDALRSHGFVIVSASGTKKDDGNAIASRLDSMIDAALSGNVIERESARGSKLFYGATVLASREAKAIESSLRDNLASLVTERKSERATLREAKKAQAKETQSLAESVAESLEESDSEKVSEVAEVAENE